MEVRVVTGHRFPESILQWGMDPVGAPIISVAGSSPEQQEKAEALAAQLGLRAVSLEAVKTPLALVVTPERLELRETGRNAAGPVYADFLTGAVSYRHRHAGKRQALARAVGIKGATAPTVLDATAGLGRDAFVLAALGCPVCMLERSEVVAALLTDGLARAAGNAQTASIVARMHLTTGDATTLMASLANGEHPEVVYLDPMYPQLGKAAKRKEMRLFRKLLGDDADAPSLLAAALPCARRRVVVKRPQHAPSLQGPPASLSMGGKTTRFDVYLC